MKLSKIISHYLLISCFLISACSINLNSKNKSSKTHLTHEEIKAAWEKSMAVSEEHKMLEKMAGEWDASVKFWTQPAGKPNISVAKSTIKSILNGKFIIEEYKGSFSGKPFEGISIMGFDSILKTFSNYWVDNMGTGAIYSEGTYNSENKVISLNGNVTDPISQTKKTTFTSLKIVNQDTHIFEMYDVFPNNKKFKTLEITYNRK